jgi:hypothetical protein
MMPFHQEIIVRTTGSVLQIFLLSMEPETGPQYFLSEVLYRVPEFSPFSNVYSISTQHSDSDSAFKVAFAWTQGFVSKRQETITGIDNPCNCPFLSKQAQQLIVSAAGLSISVLENGK